MRVIVLFLIIFPFILPAQKQTTKTPVENVPNAWNYSYFGERIYHPGFKLGYEYPLRSRDILKEKRKNDILVKSKAFQRTYAISGNLAAFYHPKNTTALMLFSNLERQKTGQYNWTRTLGFSLGYIHTFRNGETFLAKEDGSFEKIIGNQGGLFSGMQVGIGRNRVALGKGNFNWYFKMGMYLQTPFNTAITFRDFLELGIRVPIVEQKNKQI